MSLLRFARNVAMIVGVVGGTFIGYCAGAYFASDSAQMVCSFLGMSLGGAFIDYCLRGGN